LATCLQPLLAGAWSPFVTAVSPGSGSVPPAVTVTSGQQAAGLYLPMVISPYWGAVATMPSVVYRHTATLLASGKVLVEGGQDGTGFDDLARADLYDPATNTWSPAASMTEARYAHASVRLLSGKVLVAGGRHIGDTLASVEIYDPDANSWSPVAPMNKPREWAKNALLPSGKVLVAGGSCGNMSYLDDDCGAGVELYDPDTDSWKWAARPLKLIQIGTVTVLSSGKVLVLGANTGREPGEYPSPGSEIYDPASNSWSLASIIPRFVGNTATLLPSGRVLVMGALESLGGGDYRALADAFLYDPTSDAWSAAAPMLGPRYSQTATLLTSGRVLVVGGDDATGFFNLPTAELYDPSTNTWTDAGVMSDCRMEHTATLLLSGGVLIAGGSPSNTRGPTASADLFKPDK
jgi:trimeric autotransporter adhesin